ncbi:MAG: porin family protein [Flammeovirgaceae bacterium]
MRLIRFCLCVTFFAGVFFAHAQEQTCEQTLNDAQAEFDAGRFYGLPAMLKKCLEGGFTNEQRFRAYYILTQAYLVLDDPIAAEDSYLKLLKIDPEFRASVVRDPIDLYYLSKKFTSRPRFTPHYRLGLSASFPSSLADVSTYSGSTANSTGLRIAFPMLGAGIDFNINDNWAIGGEANFAPKTYSIEAKDIFGGDDVSLVERSAGFDFPIYVKYQKDSGRLRPFGYLGFAFNLLLSNSATIVSNDRSSDGRTTPSQGPDVDLLYSRNTLNRSLVFGGGVKYKVGKNFVYADLRYMLGLNNMVIADRNFYKPDGTLSETVTTYGYVSELFRLDNLSLSFGYVMPIYDPRRLKKPNAKGLFRNFPWIKKKASKK